MADGEVEAGVDDQLIDEAILGTKDGKERGELGGRGGVGSDDEEEKASRLGDNDGGRVPHVDTPPGIITGQSGKPSPASPTEITTACLQTSSRTTTASSGGGNDSGAPGPNPDGDVRQLFSFSVRAFRPHGLYRDVLRAEYLRNREPSPLSMSPLSIPGRVQVAGGVIASTQACGLYLMYPHRSPNPPLPLMSSALEPTMWVIAIRRVGFSA